jgi:hypothetical protein
MGGWGALLLSMVLLENSETLDNLIGSSTMTFHFLCALIEVLLVI